jgi:hypothetical protein
MCWRLSQQHCELDDGDMGNLHPRLIPQRHPPRRRSSPSPDASGRVTSILRALRAPALVLPSSPTPATTPRCPPLPPSCSSVATTPSSARPVADAAQARQHGFPLQRVAGRLPMFDDTSSSLPCHGGGASSSPIDGAKPSRSPRTIGPSHAMMRSMASYPHARPSSQARVAPPLSQHRLHRRPELRREHLVHLRALHRGLLSATPRPPSEAAPPRTRSHSRTASLAPRYRRLRPATCAIRWGISCRMGKHLCNNPKCNYMFSLVS